MSMIPHTTMTIVSAKTHCPDCEEGNSQLAREKLGQDWEPNSVFLVDNTITSCYK